MPELPAQWDHKEILAQPDKQVQPAQMVTMVL